MPLTTEIFVMCLFFAGLPFFYRLLKDPSLEGGTCFLAGYVSLICSNTFTVIEEFFLNRFFNICEHLFISVGAILFLIAVIRLTSLQEPKTGKATKNDAEQ